MALITLGSVLGGFLLGALLSLYAVWVGLRWAGEIARRAPVSAPTPESVRQEAGFADEPGPDGVLGRASDILSAWLPAHRRRGGGE